MDAVTVYLSKRELVKEFGKKISVELDNLVDQGLILSHEEVIAVKVDKAKARSIQSWLEFEATKRVPIGPTRPKQGDD